jgi:hypothetical protein
MSALGYERDKIPGIAKTKKINSIPCLLPKIDFIDICKADDTLYDDRLQKLLRQRLKALEPLPISIGGITRKNSLDSKANYSAPNITKPGAISIIDVSNVFGVDTLNTKNQFIEKICDKKLVTQSDVCDLVTDSCKQYDIEFGVDVIID